MFCLSQHLVGVPAHLTRSACRRLRRHLSPCPAPRRAAPIAAWRRRCLWTAHRGPPRRRHGIRVRGRLFRAGARQGHPRRRLRPPLRIRLRHPTAATIYLVWSLIASTCASGYDDVYSDEDQLSDSESPKKAGYIIIHDAEEYGVGKN
jgi:hypothetical protein